MFGSKPFCRPSLTQYCMRVGILAVSSFVLSACGGGSGDSSNTIPVTKETVALDHLSDAQLQRSASVGSKQMQSGMNNAQTFATQPAITNSVNSASLSELQAMLGMSGSTSSSTDAIELSTGNGNTGMDEGVIGTGPVEPNGDIDTTDYSSSIWNDSGVEQLIDATLGLVGNADVTRNGNSMTIDPDDNELCQHDAMDMQSDANDLQFCLDMVADVRVRIDGQTEDSGNISYLFQEDTVLQIEYAPGQTRFKLRLPGVRTVFERAAQLAPEFGSLPQVFEGVIELGSRVDNTTQGSEAGAMDFAITAPIVIQDDGAGFDMQVAASNLLHFEHDNALGTATVEMDARAFSYSVSDGELITFAGDGATFKIDLVNEGEQISVSKLGIGNGPLTLTIDSVEVMKMTLDTFGFDIDTVNERLVLTDGLNLNLMVNLFGTLFADSQSDASMLLEVSASAPDNAQFSAQSNGSIRLDNVGPFVVDLFASFGGESNSANFIASPGECFAEGSDGNVLFSQVVCP